MNFDSWKSLRDINSRALKHLADLQAILSPYVNIIYEIDDRSDNDRLNWAPFLSLFSAYLCLGAGDEKDRLFW